MYALAGRLAAGAEPELALRLAPTHELSKESKEVHCPRPRQTPCGCGFQTHPKGCVSAARIAGARSVRCLIVASAIR